MTAPVVVAQATTGALPIQPRLIRIEKPAVDTALTIRLDGTVRLDLSAIGAERITLVHVGDTLVILFDNQSTVTLAPF